MTPLKRPIGATTAAPFFCDICSRFGSEPGDDGEHVEELDDALATYHASEVTHRITLIRAPEEYRRPWRIGGVQ